MDEKAKKKIVKLLALANDANDEEVCLTNVIY